MTPPHILLVTIDAWRADHLGFLSGDPTLTPNIDRLAERSRVFGNAFTNGGWTLPAMTALLSSTYVSMYGGAAEPVQCGRPWLPELLRAHGYVTAGFTTNPCCGVEPGFERGFDHFRELRRPLPDAEVMRAYMSPDMHDALRTQARLRAEGRHPDLRTLQLHVQAKELVDEALDWLRTCGDQPVFLWLHFMDLHQPLSGSRRTWTIVDHAHAWQLFGASQSWVRGKPARRDDAQSVPLIEKYRAAYRDELRTVDEQVGRLREGVGAHLSGGIATVVTGDHGEAFGEHGRMHHSSGLFDELLRVPLIVDAPCIDPGVDHAQVQHLDVAPTLLSLAGIDRHESMLGRAQCQPQQTDGAALQPVFSERVAESSQIGGRYMLAIRSAAYKYIYDFASRRRSLYDLTADPAEQHDIAESAPADVLREFDRLRLAHVSRGLIHAMTRRELNPAQHNWQDDLGDESLARLEALGYLQAGTLSDDKVRE